MMKKSPVPSYHSHLVMLGNMYEQQSVMEYLNVPHVQHPGMPFPFSNRRGVTLTNMASGEEDGCKYEIISSYAKSIANCS